MAYPPRPSFSAPQPPMAYPPPPPQHAAGYGYPPQPDGGYPQHLGYGYPPPSGYGYPQQPGYGYPPPPGYGYPPPPGYRYPPPPGYGYPQDHRPSMNEFGVAVGAGLIGAVTSDAIPNDIDGGIIDGSGF